ncbi:MAG: PASTA domain-containing protein [Clostridia bacterium]|nr:PASTA domain-containing protein [Clostridia bacterium]
MNQVRNRIEKRTYKRYVISFCLLLVVSVVIVGKLAGYQLKQYDFFQGAVLNQVTAEYSVNPERGTITDRNGNILATNITVYNVVLSPKDIHERLAKDAETLADNDPKNDIMYVYDDDSVGIHYRGTRVDEMIGQVLAVYLDADYNEIMKKAAKEDRMYEVVKKNVDEATAQPIRDFIAQFNLGDEIYFNASSKRYYPKGELAAHAVGFTNSEGVGIYGLERYYNNLLEGTSGRYILAQDARNNDMPFEYERYIEASNGYNITTTIDMYIQYELENQLEKTFLESGAGNRVTGIVMDVNDGSILAMATYPGFDLNDPYTLDEFSEAKLFGMDQSSNEYKALYQELMYNMWNNKAITETYEPGSTFKIVTTAMAFEEGVVTEEESFYCPGYAMVEGWSDPISCHRKTGHGVVSFRVGLQQSCNPTLMSIASRVGNQRFYEYFESFGYTGKTGIDVPGEVGGIYSGLKDFGNVSLAVYSFGQTFKTTAIQQLRAIAAVANGGYLVTPHFLSRITDDNGNIIQSYETEIVRQVISTDVCERITDILEEGVSGDGGAKNAYVKGYRVAAKTGTSEKRDKIDEYGEKSYRVGSCVAYAPADDPQIAAIIIVDEPSIDSVFGSVVAAPYISNLMSFILPYIGVEAQYTEEELENQSVTISNYIGASVENTVTDLSWRSFKYEIIGGGDTVTAQVPAAGSQISAEDGRLLLYTGEAQPVDSISVPDLTGMTAFNANKVLVQAGLNPIYEGSLNGSTATVISQSPAAGTMVTKGTVVNVVLRHLDLTD